MTRVYYVVENEYGEPESKECDSIKEAIVEKSHIDKYYKKELGWNDYPLEIVEYTEYDAESEELKWQDQ